MGEVTPERLVQRIETCVTLLGILLTLALAGFFLQVATAYRVAEVQDAVQELQSATVVQVEPAKAGGE